MLVTWPFVMLLLNYWPLQRLQMFTSNPPPRKLHPSPAVLHPLLREKLPFFVLSGVSCILTYLTEGGRQGAGVSVGSPALLRLENAFVAYARYLGKTLWPVRLAVPYVNPGHWSWLEVGGSVLVVVGVCLVVLWLGRRWPYLLVGWCWYLGTLMPVIGLTKGWGTFMADRFTYLPQLGLYLMVAWGAVDGAGVWRGRRVVLASAAVVIVTSLLVAARVQTRYWRDSISLWTHTLACTPENSVAHHT